MIIVCLLVVEVYVELRDMLRYLVCFCDMTSCRLVDSYQCFEGTCCTHLEVSYPEGEGSKFLCKRNHNSVTAAEHSTSVFRDKQSKNSSCIACL